MTEQDGVPFGGITPHTFQNLTDSQKLDVIIDTLNRTCSECRKGKDQSELDFGEAEAAQCYKHQAAP